MTYPVVVLVRDRSSGRIHKRFRDHENGPLSAYEGDNADDAGEFDEVTFADVERASREDMCLRCWPEPVA
jgi:hypothetical protein